ncbi:hypothetical protein PPS11_15091 [Pseudomonas putida S11]|nr:hypothetical protein PPS11_15091 [Pseudomonas putida S11]
MGAGVPAKGRKAAPFSSRPLILVQIRVRIRSILAGIASSAYSFAHYFLARVNHRITLHRRIHQPVRLEVAVGVLHMVADVGHHLRLQQVVHVGIPGLLIRCIGRHGNHVEPHRRAFPGDRVAHLHPVLRLLGAVLRLQYIPREAHHHADVAIGQVAGVLRGVEVADIRSHLHQQRLGLVIVRRVLAVVRQAQVVQGDR